MFETAARAGGRFVLPAFFDELGRSIVTDQHLLTLILTADNTPKTQKP